MTQPTGLEEVLAHEATIRRLLPKATGRLATEARAVLNGRPAAGTRLDALRDVAARLQS